MLQFSLLLLCRHDRECLFFFGRLQINQIQKALKKEQQCDIGIVCAGSWAGKDICFSSLSLEQICRIKGNKGDFVPKKEIYIGEVRFPGVFWQFATERKKVLPSLLRHSFLKGLDNYCILPFPPQCGCFLLFNSLSISILASA